jgi:hypothetical protein
MFIKSIQEYNGPDYSKTFIHDEDSCQLMTVNKNADRKGYKKLEKPIFEV